MARVMTVE